MAAFQNQSGNVALAKLDARGNVPVADQLDRSVLEAILLQLRGIRLGLEMLNDLEAGDLIRLAQETEG